MMRATAIVFALLLLVSLAAAQQGDKLPPRPPRYFNDFAGVVTAQTAQRLNARLEQYDRESSNQIVVAIYPKF